MGPKHLTYFKVENFKRFDTLEVKDIGQFNLIVGDNNVGKTSLLEALLFDDDSNQFLLNIAGILKFRKISIPNSNTKNYIDFFANNLSQSIKYKFELNNETNFHTLNVLKKTRSSLTEVEIEMVRVTTLIYGPAEHLIEFDLDSNKNIEISHVANSAENFERYIPYIGFNTNYDNDILNFFSKISINTKKLKALEEELRYFLPTLNSIEINNAIVPGTPLLTIREADNDLKPVAQYGDGFIKFFRYLLEVELCENKRLMIDEIDAGIHYSRMKEFLKKVLLTAKNKNVQLFATTHSKECLQYFTSALEELGYQDDGRVIKLANIKNSVRAYTSRFAEFENALYAESEIR